MFPSKASTHSSRIHSALNESNTHSLSTLKLLAHLVEETSDILTAADVDFKPVTWNKASEKIYGLKAGQVIGKDLRDFIVLDYAGASREEVRQLIHANGEWRGECSFIRPTDKKRITLLMCFKQLKEEENLLGYLISATDITERKESESRLKESEQRFRDMADSSPAMIWLSDENNATVYVNKKWIDFTGRDIINDPHGWTKLIHPNDLEKTISEFFKGVEQKEQITIVYRLRRTDGVYRWVHDTSVPRFLSNGKFIGYIGTVIDIEDQRQKHEQLLYESTILENLSDIIVTTDLNVNVRSWNKVAERYYGYSEKDAIGKRMGSLVPFIFHGTSAQQSLAELNEKGIWQGELSLSSKEGKTRHFFHTVTHVYDEKGNKVGYLSIGRDITQKKIAEEKLKESEIFYRTLIADSIDGMILLNKEGVITFASPSVKNVLDYEVEDLVGKNAFQFVHPNDIAWAAQSFQKEVNADAEIKFITVRLLKKNGQWLWCTVRGNSLLSNPNVNSVVVHFQDDTLRKQAKDALQESEKRFRSLVTDLQIGVFLSDEGGNIIMCNNALSQMLSVPQEMIVGKNVYELMSIDMTNEAGEFMPVSKRPLTQTIQTKQKIKGAVIGVLNPTTNERSWIMVNTNPILDESGNIKHVICSVMDLTERKKLEEQLVADETAHQRQLTQATIDGQENERKEIGKELHDNIGQRLTTIKLFLDYAKSTADESTGEMINMALKTVSGVINDVRAMSRSLVPFTLKDLGLIESINELIVSLAPTKTLNIKFEHRFDENALPENQKLTLFRIVQEQLNNIVKHSGAKNVHINMYAAARHLFLQIRDDGKGFDAEKVRKGIGIINIKNRVELFNGRTEITSKPGNGCVLLISFPISPSV